MPMKGPHSGGKGTGSRKKAGSASRNGAGMRGQRNGRQAKKKRPRKGAIIKPMFKPDPRWREMPDPKKYLNENIESVIKLGSFTDAMISLTGGYGVYLWKRLPGRHGRQKFMRRFNLLNLQRMRVLEQMHKTFLTKEMMAPRVKAQNLGAISKMLLNYQRDAERAGRRQVAAKYKAIRIELIHLAQKYRIHKPDVIMELDREILDLTNEHLLFESRVMLGDMAGPFFDELHRFSILALEKLNKVFPPW